MDMNMVQIHPTAFIDPQDPTNPTKVSLEISVATALLFCFHSEIEIEEAL